MSYPKIDAAHAAYAEADRRSTFEERLWAAVVLQAVQDMDNQSPAVMRRAKRWLFTDTRRDVGSFDWICRTLALPKGRILTAAMTREGRKGLIGGFSKEKKIDLHHSQRDEREGAGLGREWRDSVDDDGAENTQIRDGAAGIRVRGAVSRVRGSAKRAGGAR